MNIFILDNEKENIDLLKEYTKTFFGKTECNYTIKYYTSPNEFLQTHFGDDDIIFLAIKTPVLNGFEVAKRIRLYNKKNCICFIAKDKEFIDKAYEVHAFDFLVEPVSEEKIHHLFSEILRYCLPATKNEKLGFITTLGEVFVNLEDILYFEYIEKSDVHINRCTKIKVNNDYFLIKEKISDIYSKLNKKYFFRSHKSFIINFKNIRFLSKGEIIMKNGEKIPVSQKKRKIIKQEFNKYINHMLEKNY